MLLSNKELEEIEQQLHAASPWPWHYSERNSRIRGADESQIAIVDWNTQEADLTFVVLAPMNISSLLNHIDALKKKLNHAGQWIANADVALEPGWEGSRDSILREIEETLGWHEDDVDFDIRFNRPGLTGGKK